VLTVSPIGASQLRTGATVYYTYSGRRTGIPSYLTIGPSATILRKTARHTKYLPRLQFHLIERSRLPSRRSTDRAGALSVGSYALLNSLAVCCLYHRCSITTPLPCSMTTFAKSCFFDSSAFELLAVFGVRPNVIVCALLIG
jgi:hypothetical protein